MLSLNLLPIFKARGIERPYSFLVKAGLTPHTANSLLNSRTRIFRLDHIEKLCLILNCEPNELLVWHPNKNEVITDNHPMIRLKHDESTDLDLKETLSKMSYRELKSLSTKIKEEAKKE
jgi:DNA-binding Xre family transcriptional regulator